MTTKIKLSINGTEIELTPDDVKELRRALDAFDSASPYGDTHIVIVSPPTFISPPVSVPMWRPIHETAPLEPWEWRITCASTTNGFVIMPEGK